MSQIVNYPRRDKGPARVLGKQVEFDPKERRWVSTPIRVLCGPRKALR